MAGGPEELVRAADLDHAAGVHDGDLPREGRYHGQVVAHVQGGDVVQCRQLADRRQHVRLRRDVQAGGRLVQDDEPGPVREGHREPDPLLLAAGGLVRVPLEEGAVVGADHLRGPAGVGDAGDQPLLRRQPRQLVEADYADWQAVERQHREHPAPGRAGGLLHEGFDRPPARCGDRFGVHDRSDPQVPEPFPRDIAREFRLRGRDQEPADQRQPQPSYLTEQERLDEPERDEHRPEALASLRRDCDGAGSVSGALPHRGSQHPPAVERCARQQVEHAEDEVGEAQPRQTRTSEHRQPAAAEVRHAEARAAEHQAGAGAGCRDEQIGLRTGRFAFQLRRTAEHPQRDPLDLHAVAAGQHGVGQLMGQQRRHEQHRGQHRGDPVPGRGIPGRGARQLRGAEQPGQQPEHDGDRPVCPHSHAGVAPQRDRCPEHAPMVRAPYEVA